MHRGGPVMGHDTCPTEQTGRRENLESRKARKPEPRPLRACFSGPFSPRIKARSAGSRNSGAQLCATIRPPLRFAPGRGSLFAWNAPFPYVTAMSRRCHALLCLLWLWCTGPGAADDIALIGVGDEWRFVPGIIEPSVPATAWREPGFDDGGWLLAPGRLPAGGRGSSSSCQRLAERVRS